MPGFGRTASPPAPSAPPARAAQPGAFQAFGRVGHVGGPNAGGNYFADGRYYVVLNRISAGNSQQGQGEFAAVEFTIVEVTTGFDANPHSTPPTRGSNKPGERVSVVYMFTKHGDVAVSNFRGMIGAAAGMDPDATDPESAGYAPPAAWEQACYKAIEKDGTALAGIVLDVTAISILTKRKTPFTKTIFAPVDEATEARILGLLGRTAA